MFLASTTKIILCLTGRFKGFVSLKVGFPYRFPYKPIRDGVSFFSVNS